MNDDRRRNDMLIEEATTAWRPTAPGGVILTHPAWADLDPESRDAVFVETVAARRLEQALDRDGVSTTVQAVLSRLEGE